MTAANELPLAGIRVIDFTQVMMGPVATQMLGDYGADVIKVESPDGDVTRQIGPTRHPGMGPVFLNTNRSKRSICLDLKKPAGREAVLRLIKTADVLVYNVRPQAMARLGLGYDAVMKANPEIIYCLAVGYGSDGPNAGQAVYDDLTQAGCGIAGLFGAIDNHPRDLPPGANVAHVDVVERFAVAVMDVERFPIRREQRLDAQAVDLEAQAQQ